MQEAYIQGVSTRRVDDLVRALGMEGISKSQVSRMCQELDEEVEGFRTRGLEGPYPYLWLDATFVKVREQGRVVSQAVVIAIGVKASGEREVLGLDVAQVKTGLSGSSSCEDWWPGASRESGWPVTGPSWPGPAATTPTLCSSVTVMERVLSRREILRA